MEGGAGRFLRHIPGPDVIPLAPSADDLFLSGWFVPTTAVTQCEQGLPFVIRHHEWRVLNEAFFLAPVLMTEENILPSCIY